MAILIVVTKSNGMEARGTGVRHGSFEYGFCAVLVHTWSILKYQPS
jgi:hypothetical protein